MPTMTKSGVPGLEIKSWIGLFEPAKTPPGHHHAPPGRDWPVSARAKATFPNSSVAN